MDVIIFWPFILIILLLNVAVFKLYKNGKLNLIFLHNDVISSPSLCFFNRSIIASFL